MPYHHDYNHEGREGGRKTRDLEREIVTKVNKRYFLSGLHAWFQLHAENVQATPEMRIPL